MAKINLLPWRAERRAAKQKEFYTLLGIAAAVGVVLVLGINFYYGQQIDGQNARNDYLKGEIKKVEAQIKEIDELDKQKSRLLARKKVIEELQANRSQMVHLFDSLVRTIPDGVVLTGIKQSGGEMTLEGRAQSNTRVSVYMKNLETSGWMAKPELNVIEAKPDPNGKGVAVSRSLPYSFSLKVQLAQPEPGDDEGAPLNSDGSPGGVTVVNTGSQPAVPAAPATAAKPQSAPVQPAPATPQPRPAS